MEEKPTLTTEDSSLSHKIKKVHPGIISKRNIMQGFRQFRSQDDKDPFENGALKTQPNTSIRDGPSIQTHKLSNSGHRRSKSEESVLASLNEQKAISQKLSMREHEARATSSSHLDGWKSANRLKLQQTCFPKYHQVIHAQFAQQIPSLTFTSSYNAQASSLIAGPDEGIFELIEEIQNHTQLKQWNEFKEKIKHNIEVETDFVQFWSLLEQLKKKGNDTRVYGKTIDTYAVDYMKNGEKPGQPNADTYLALVFPKKILGCVADGIGWGLPSRRASQSALLGSLIYFFADESRCQKIMQTNETTALARHLLKSLEIAHLATASFSTERTTILCGILMEIQDSPNRSSIISCARRDHGGHHSPTLESTSSSQTVLDESFSDSSVESESSISSEENEIEALLCTPTKKKRKYLFLGFSLGDTLAYRWSCSTAEVMEITMSDRSEGVRDAGGSIGENEADTRNLRIFMVVAEEGDLIIMCSDGVHDNLDPEVLRVSPREIGLDSDRWSGVPMAVRQEAKRKYKERQLAEIIGFTKCSPKTSTNKIIEFTTEVTKRQREVYEVGSKLQRDWNTLDEKERTNLNDWVRQNLKEPVGKFDHVTCLSLYCGDSEN